MTHLGIFDPGFRPIKVGGLTEADRDRLVKAGWVEGTTDKETKNVEVGFRNPDFPEGTIHYLVDIPAGVSFLSNQELGQTIYNACGNCAKSPPPYYA